MQVVHERCCGLDVHQKVITACAIVPGKAGRPTKHRASFETMSRDLLGLLDWPVGLGVTHVAMESTGVLWQPVWNLLEARAS